MKAWITSNGQLVIQPETETQAFALKAWLEIKTKLSQSFTSKEEVIKASSILIEALKGGE